MFAGRTMIQVRGKVFFFSNKIQKLICLLVEDVLARIKHKPNKI